MKKNLIVTGGIFHPFEETSNSLSNILSEMDYVSEITLDVEKGFSNLDNYDLLTMNFLRWRMLNHEKYIPYLDEWQFSLSKQGQKHLKNYLKNGGSIIAFHTSSICFDDWPDYKKIIGGKWVWDKTYHPPQGIVEISPISDHKISENINNFEINDEIYHHLELEDSSEPFLKGLTKETNEEHIIGWTYQFEKGKVVYNALGHDSESLENENFVKIIKQSINWLEGNG